MTIFIRSNENRFTDNYQEPSHQIDKKTLCYLYIQSINPQLKQLEIKFQQIKIRLNKKTNNFIKKFAIKKY